MGQILPDPIPDYIAAYNARDVERMLSYLAPDIRFTNLSDGSVTADASGLDEFADLARAALGLFSSRHQAVRSSLSVANTTIAEIRYAATVAQDLPNGWQQGQQVRLTGLSLFEVEGGQITRLVDQV
ncbi:nuclear transport factor 2 family protein [Roseibium sp. MMSF_3544]|uniref:nuclear transport factor 2 family protein n=1 Tax=unclassified Roseibium TaxID=2629323 RepID=UPI00273E846F|nr:nuclear transport factor 2 family protein [Roseibium sp. MMSF_3544]